MVKLKTTLLAVAVSLAVTGVAQAGFADGDAYSVTLWNGTYSALGLSGTPSSASAATVSNVSNLPYTASFQYVGPLDFSGSGTQTTSGTIGAFFGTQGTINNYQSGVSGISETTLFNQTLSTPNSNTDGSLNSSATVTFLEITGTYSAPAGTILQLAHASGATLTIGPFGTDFFTGQDSTAGTYAAPLDAATGNLFTLVYADANGQAPVLQLTEPVALPEPGSLALLGTGLASLLLLRRRARRA